MAAPGVPAAATDAGRETVVRDLVRGSLRFSFGGIERGGGYGASWNGVDKTFPRLVATDLPFLVRLVRDPKANEEQRLAARMLISCFGLPMRAYVSSLQREETDAVVRLYWVTVLDLIDMNERIGHVCR